MKSMISLGLALWLGCSSAYAQSEVIRLDSSGRFLHVEGGTLQVGSIKARQPSTMWEKLAVGNGLFCLRNRHSGQYLVASGSGVTTTSKAPSSQGIGPHYWRYTQPFPSEPTVSVLTSQSGLYVSDKLSLEKAAPASALRIAEAGEPSQPEAPAAGITYQRLVNSKQSLLSVDRGGPAFGPADPNSPGCMWDVQEMAGPNRGPIMTFTNRSTGQMLSSSGKSLTTEAAGPVQSGQEAYVWRVTRDNSGQVLELTNSQGALIRGLRLEPVR